MPTRPLGRTGLSVTELGFGGGAIGGLFAPVSREAAMEAMEAAWQAGMRYFDTAPFYGHGQSERRVGDFLRDKNGYVLSTKVGKLLAPVPREQVPDMGFVDPLPFDIGFDYSGEGIIRSVEASYARLGLNRIDIVFVHDLERESLGADYSHHLGQFLASGATALDELKDQGVIQGWGLGVNQTEAALAVMRAHPLDVLLMAGRYTLLDRSAADEVMPLCESHGTGVVIGGVFNSGILATGAVAGAHFNYAEPDETIRTRVTELQAEAERQGGTLASAALDFALANAAVSSVLIGSAHAGSIVRNAALRPSRTDWDWNAFDPMPPRP